MPDPNLPQMPTPAQPNGNQAQLEQDRFRQKQGTGFTNINRILGANQGAGQRMGQQIGQSLSNKAGQINQGTQARTSGFQAGLTSGSSDANAAIGAAGDISKNITAGGTGWNAPPVATNGGTIPVTGAGQTQPIDYGRQQIQPARQPIYDGNPHFGQDGGEGWNSWEHVGEQRPQGDKQYEQIGSSPRGLTPVGQPGQDGYRGPLNTAANTGLGDATVTPLVQSLTTTTPYDYAAAGKALQNANYTGPTGLANAAQLGSQAQNLQQQGNLANTGYGQQQLLKNLVAARGNYNQGQSSLDKLLLGNQQAQQNIQQGKAQIGGATQGATNAINSAQEQAQGATGAINQQKAAALDQIKNQASGINADATKRATDYNTAGSDLQKALQISPDDFKNLDQPTQQKYISLIQNMGQYGLDPTQSFYKGLNGNDIGNSVVGNFGNSFATGAGGQYYKDPTQQAQASNLSKFLGNDATTQGAIDNNKFNTNLFNPTTANTNSYLNPANQARQNDLGTQSYKNAEADELGTLINALRNPNGVSMGGGASYGSIQGELSKYGDIAVPNDPTSAIANIQAYQDKMDALRGEAAKAGSGQDTNLLQAALAKFGLDEAGNPRRMPGPIIPIDPNNPIHPRFK